MEHKSKPGKLIPGLMFLMILLSALCSLIGILSGKKGATESRYYADIYSGGKLLESIPLWQVSAPYTIQITGENSGTNKLLISPGEISVTDATCPDQICIHQGPLSDSALPIVCLPNRLVVQLRKVNDTDTVLDIVTH